MSEPPVHASPPDRHFDDTYAGVGKALSAWERLEIHLSHLHSIFVGRPRERSAMIEYGREGRIFTDRMRVLSAAAEHYFVRKPSQAVEGAFDEIVDEAISLSINRHQIAHGLVASIPIVERRGEKEEVRSIGYLLVPPWYAFQNLTKAHGQPYFYGSEALLHYAKKFIGCSARAKKLGLALDPPSADIAEFVSQYDELDRHQYMLHGR